MKIKFLSRLLLQGAFAAAVMAGTCWQAAAQNSEYAEQVQRQMEAAKATLRQNGYKETHDRRYAMINAGVVESYRVTLRQEWEYIIFGVCDNDCTDLDITIYDSSGREMVKDVTADDRPVVRLAPSRTGEYRIQIRMYKCSNSPCVYGAGIAGK